jgi:hypothetical protein
LKGGENWVKKKLLDFEASVSDVRKINPLFSTCKVRVMYTGKNRNMSTINKDAVEKALPTLKNIPIVGEFSVENQDFKGHGGAIDLSDYKFIHTTKPYGVVPESATYEWVKVKGKDGNDYEYLEVNGCYLWTGRYEEAESVIENGKGQSMEIEVVDGSWDNYEESYVINDFVFSALCILGDNVEPAFEDAKITAYSFDKDSFKQEFSLMLSELKTSLSQNKEVNDMEKLKELLEQYSIKMEDVTAEGIELEGLSEEEMEVKFAEVFGNKGAKNKDQKQTTNNPNSDDSENMPKDEKGKEPVPNDKGQKPNNDGDAEDAIDGGADEAEEDKAKKAKKKSEKNSLDEEPKENFELRVKELEGELDTAKSTIASQKEELENLRAFKLNVEKADKEGKAQKLFKDFQLSEEDVQGIDIHAFSLEEIEEKCYAILGRKLASKKNFSKEENKGIHLPLNNGNENNNGQHSRYGNLFSK